MLHFSDAEIAISRGWWDVSEKIIMLAHKQKQDIDGSVRAAVQKVKQRSDELLRLLNVDAHEMQVFSPAFQWAQSADSIFLNIKFAFRWSAPGALSVTDEVVRVENNTFYFSGIGEHSQVRKKYELNLPLFSEIIANATEWSFGSVGKLTVTMKKNAVSNWLRLTESTGRISNSGIWWDMQEKHKKSIDDLYTTTTTTKFKAAANDENENDDNKSVDGAEQQASDKKRRQRRSRNRNDASKNNVNSGTSEGAENDSSESITNSTAIGGGSETVRDEL